MELLVFDWQDMAYLAMETSVVEPVDVLRHGGFEVVDVPPWALVADKFGLEQRVERLGEGVVIAIAFGLYGGDGVCFFQPLGVADRTVLGVFNRSKQQLLLGLSLAGPRRLPLECAILGRRAACCS